MRPIVLFVAALVLAVLTLVHPQWMEALGVDPDGGSGALESAVAVVVLVTAAVLLGRTLRLRRRWRRYLGAG